MRTLLFNTGPIAHLDFGNPEKALVGAEMSDTENLIMHPGGAILIEKGLIKKIGESGDMLEEYASDVVGTDTNEDSTYGRGAKHIDSSSDTIVVDISGLAVVPGFVDAHTHLLWSGDRARELKWRLEGKSYREIAENGGGIGYTVSETRNTPLGELEFIGKTRIKEATRNGTTAMEVKSGYGLSTNSELALLDCANNLSKNLFSPSLNLTWLGAHAAPPGDGDSEKRRTDYVDEIISEQLPQVVEQGFARYADVFCEPGWFTLDETERICNSAKEADLAIRLHVDEFSDGGGAGLAAELGAVTADHAHYSNDEGRASCAKSGTMQGFLLGTPYVMGEKHWPPISQCIEEKWPWMLATDFNPNCQTLSMPFVGSIASQHLGIDPLATLVASTRNPALTVEHKSGHRHGVLSEGSAASLNVLNSKHWESWCQTPGHTPCQATMIDGMWVEGQLF